MDEGILGAWIIAAINYQAESFCMSTFGNTIVVLKEYGNDLCLIAIKGGTGWNPDAQIRLARRRKTASGIVYDPESLDRSPAYKEIEKALRGLGLNVCTH